MPTIVETMEPTTQPTESAAPSDGRRFSAPLGHAAELQMVVDTTSIDVRLSNSVPVSALRFEITFEKKFNYRAPDISTRVQGFNNYVNFQDNVITFVLLDIEGKGIAPGTGTIVTIPLEGEQHFDVTGAFASTRTSGISEIPFQILGESPDEDTLVLEQNDPNPFMGKTRLDFRIPSDSDTKLVIYDVGGALIRTLVESKLGAGVHSVEWDGTDDCGKSVDSGIYLYKLYAGVYSVTKKMVYLSEAAVGK